MPSFQIVIQNWIRQEIVDDDPYDEETFFPNKNGDQSKQVASWN